MKAFYMTLITMSRNVVKCTQSIYIGIVHTN